MDRRNVVLALQQMNLSADQITIAVTVYNRRDFLKRSIGSALEQTVPVRVMVVEDCGPDPGMESYIKSLFGERVSYFRSPRRRGIFGNWNTCLEQCPTAWISILHDDDWLEPGFVAAMLKLSDLAGNCGLYFGRTKVVDMEGRPKPQWGPPPLPDGWSCVELNHVIFTPPFSFPGQLFRIACAKDFGGFRESSLFCGEWELWSKIIARYKAAKTDTPVAVFRDHDEWGRGTNRVYRSGKTYGLIAVQTKRNLALAKRIGLNIAPELAARFRFTMPLKYILRYGAGFSPRILKYNLARVQSSAAPNWRYALLQMVASLGGPRAVRVLCKLCNSFEKYWA